MVTILQLQEGTERFQPSSLFIWCSLGPNTRHTCNFDPVYAFFIVLLSLTLS